LIDGRVFSFDRHHKAIELYPLLLESDANHYGQPIELSSDAKKKGLAESGHKGTDACFTWYHDLKNKPVKRV
jgi:hypothetical protein